MKKLFILSFAALTSLFSIGQITVDNTTQSPQQLVQNVLAGSGVAVSNVTFNGSALDAQSPNVHVGYFDATGTTFPISEGLILATGNAQVAVGPNNLGSAGNWETPGYTINPDPDLMAINTAQIADQAMIEFDFIPQGDSLVFNYIFGSDEYPEFVNGGFNDAFGFFISGPGFAGPFQNGAENIALVPGTTTPVTIDNVNSGLNAQYYVDNIGGQDVQFDGYTTTLQAACQVQCGQTYHIKIAINDAGDGSYDSAVFLEASSFSSNGSDIDIELVDENGDPISGNELIEGCTSASISFVGPAGYTDSSYVVNVAVSGTATNGVDYTTINPSYTIPPGSDTLTISITAILDALTEPTETLIISTFYINACGDTIAVTDTINIIDTAPSYNVLTTDITIDCPTMNLPISASTDGGIPNLIYDWGAFGTGQTVNVPGNMGGTTTYNVTVTDACGIVSSGSVDVTLNAGPTPTLDFNQNTFINCPTDTAFIDATLNNAYDPSQVTYNWSPTGGIVEDIAVSPNVLTWYYLSVFDGCYNILDSVKVEMGTVNLNSIAVTGATDCPNQGSFVPGTITVDPNALPLWNYTLTGAGNTVGPQASGSFGNLAGGITYFLNVENDLGCSIDTAVFVPTTGLPMVAFLDSISHVDCAGDNNGTAYVSGISGGPGGPTYDLTWTHITNGIHDQVTGLGTGSSANQINLYGGDWSVVILDQAGCAWEELFTINEPAPLVLNWVANDVVCFNDANGSVIVNPQGGNGGNTVSIYDDFLGGNQINNSGTSNANQLVMGMYYATVTDNKGCTVSDSIFINEPGLFTANLTINNPPCYGIPAGTAQVTSGLNGQGAPNSWTYIWTPNPSLIANGIGANFINQLAAGQYTLTINDAVGCTYNETFTVTYPPELKFNVTDGLGTVPSQCRVYSYQNGNGVIYASATGGTGAPTYLWTNLTTGMTSPNSTWGGLNPADYSIFIQDGNGCILTDTVTLDSVSPIASFDVTSAEFLTSGVYEGTALVNVNFTNTSQNFIDSADVNSVATFFWTLDSTNNLPWYLTNDFFEQLDTTYANAGIYPVCLQVINDNGCEDVTCKDMIIYDPLLFTPVNVFTPNNDGDNDVFTFANWAQAVATFECTIVNRWGQTVHIMNDIIDEWDGTHMSTGNPCSDGLYFYSYSGISTDGTQFSGQGNVHIFTGP